MLLPPSTAASPSVGGLTHEGLGRWCWGSVCVCMGLCYPSRSKRADVNYLHNSLMTPPREKEEEGEKERGERQWEREKCGGGKLLQVCQDVIKFYSAEVASRWNR